MSVPRVISVCQVLALLLVAAALWFALPRYQFLMAQNGAVLRADLRTGQVCYGADLARCLP